MHFDPKRTLSWARRGAMRVRAAVRRFLFENKAVSTVEYALIVVAIVAILGIAAATMTDAFNALFDTFNDEIQNGIANIAG